MKNINIFESILTAFRKEFWGVFEKILLGVLIVYVLSQTFFLNTTKTTSQQFVYLADSFIHGTLNFREIPGSMIDVVWYQGKLYWSAGPFPAVLLMPFVLFFRTAFLQGYLQFPLTVLNFYLVYAIALRLGIKKKINAVWLSFGYLFGTMYLGVALNSNSWRFAQVVATALILLAILEYLGKKRFWLIGFLMAASFATRVYLLLGLAFFLLGIVYDSVDWKKKCMYALRLMTPVFFMGILLLGYNYARFGNLFETGYSFGPWNSNSPIRDQTGSERYVWGIPFEYTKGKIFSPLYIPTNLYYYFFKGPDPVLLSPNSFIITPPFIRSGIPARRSIEFNNFLISAPLFLLALLGDTKEKLVKQGWLAAGLIFLPLLFFFAPTQRYFLDFAPFLLIPLARALESKINFPVKTLIVISFFVNLMLLYSNH